MSATASYSHAHRAASTAAGSASGAAGAPGVGASSGYRRLARKRLVIIAALVIVLVASAIVNIAWGPSSTPIAQVVKALAAPGSVNAEVSTIVWQLRLPVALMAILVGAALSAGGAEMQTILGNPLAEPFTLGISAAAGFGAAVAVVLGISVVPFAGSLFIAGNAWVAAMIACAVIVAFSRLRSSGAETMILLGIALVFLFNALLSFMQYISSAEATQEIVFWTLGSLGRSSWTTVVILAAALAVVGPVLAANNWKLTAMRMGDERAASMGVHVERVRILVLIAVSLLAATAVAFVGIVGFVGLIGPHIARMLVGEDHRFFLPAATLVGAALLSVTSVVSQVIIPGAIIPIGIVTAVIGVPVFLIVIFSRRRRLWG